MRPIGEFVGKIPGNKTTERNVLDLEFVVCQGLRFQFKIHHAHTAAQGILLDMQVRARCSSELTGRPPEHRPSRSRSCARPSIGSCAPRA